MGLFDWFRRTTSDQVIQGELSRLAPTLFPGGHDEITSAGRKISALLDNRIPPASASKLYASTKYLAHTATDKSKERVVAYIQRQGMGLIDTDDASAIYDRFIANKPSQPPSAARQAAAAAGQASSRRTEPSLGSEASPIVIEPPTELQALRRQLRKMLRGTKYAELAEADEAVDGMIAERIKISRMEELLGEEGTTWQCGKREYLKGAIQSQQVIFTDGRPPRLLFFDFSRFGGSSDWGRGA